MIYPVFHLPGCFTSSLLSLVSGGGSGCAVRRHGAESHGDQVFCYGLRDQIGILCDGTVVPCCLDHDGDLALGNLLETDLETILNSDRARTIYQGFQHRFAAEELCRKCGYARRFG